MLQLRDITRTVTLPNGEDLHILRGVNCDIASGEHISIVGHSGTGKSTLLNIIGLLDQPSSGTYMWDDIDVVSLSDAHRSRLRGESVGFVFQQFNLFPSRTVLNNVEVPLFYNSGLELYKRHEKAARILESVGLGDRLDAYPSQLSGGEQQRVAIARALVRNPRLILADEPTGALDPDTGMQVMDVLERAAQKNNAALIVISHDMNVAQRANTVYRISDGVLNPIGAGMEVLSTGDKLPGREEAE
ncbi:ABC transporter ATP-binding protein [Arcanobacterium phocae]|uniref:Putative ABC transport system ATP-binding protein n=1 Tax=Arcanobacterium phocae TaxID=131112 RepID=A0A1H2LP39_9ACTO|nr:ABC transporter ATP-binding protein [Arcanobacterium phocae]SDU82689.1 putative ABC transport system ATP-binding protein [Arcanobacterium phocae]